MAHPVIGLDISDSSVELTAVVRRKGSFRVVATGRGEIPAGAISLGVIVDPEAVTLATRKLLDDVFGAKRGMIRAGITLPEMLVFTKTFSFPASLSHELVKKAVTMEAADLFPIPFHRACTAMSHVSRTKDTQEVLFAVADRGTVGAYVDALRKAGVQVLFAEAESMSTGRSLLDPANQVPSLIADIGSRSTVLAVHDAGGLRMSGNVMVAGDALTVAIEKRLGLSLAESEALRRRAGFDPSVDDGRAFLAMEQPMHEIIEEMRRTMVYYEERTGRRIARIVLAGGASLTPQMADYVGSNFPEAEVRMGNPLREASLDGLPEAEEVAAAPVLWSSSIGLALRAAGVRGGPDVNLLPGANAERGIQGLIGRYKEAVTGFIAMVTKGKKAAPRRKKAAPAAPASHEEVVASVQPPVRLQIDVAPPAPPAPADKKEVAPAPAKPAAPVDAAALSSLDILVSNASAEPASPPAPVAPAPAEKKEAPPAAAKPAASADAEEKDYGANIGDILAKSGSIETTDMGVSMNPESAADVAETRRSIASILEQRNAPAPQVKQAAASVPPRAVRAPVADSGKGRTIAMIVAVLVLFSASAFGIAMFIRKNGAPEIPSFVTNLLTRKEKLPEQSVVTPVAPEVVHVSVLLSAKETEHATRPVVVGRTIETDVEKDGSFPATGPAAESVGGKARGKATIINETAQAYTFVATTRLLSKDGVLFRMVSASPIPANGSVSVDIVADQSGASGDIGPTTFTIPGLPAGTQKVVYAKSDAAMTGGSGAVKTMTQADLDAAKEAVAEKARIEAFENLKALLGEGEQLNEDLVTVNEMSVIAPAVGSAAAEFTVRLTLRYRVLLLPEAAIAPLLQESLAASLPEGLSIADYRLGSLHYAVEAYDTATEKAEVRVEAPVITTLE